MNTDARWEQARELFLDLADLPEPEQQPELERLAEQDAELAAWVRDLLRHDRTTPLDPATTPGPAAPSRFGPYEVVRPIGRGGMGEVFIARRADGEYEQEVAVKLLHDGAAQQELVQRFLRERQTLALLDHEYIARLVDGGTTEAGQPYLVMEYVDGVPADAFAARLELKERLELFVRIGQAVSHAHERGFVHRDLKPSNILVRADGTPRLLDFGIARPDPSTQTGLVSEQPLTRTGHRLYTPEYASPEQVRGEIATIQSDIFAMGVLLYEFLCGEGPWTSDPGASLHALERSICEDDPVPPSRHATGTARRRIAGDLDAIVLQCLSKRPERRYHSVAELCADIEAHLAGLPIGARRTGAMGRAVRFARRKPAYPIVALLLMAAGVATVAALDSGEQVVRQRTELATTVSDRITVAQERWAAGDLEAAHAELDAAMLSLEELPAEKQLAADVLAQMAIFANFQLRWHDGLALVDRASALLEEVDEPEPRTLAKLLDARAFALQKTDPGERSLEATRVALGYATAYLEPGDVFRVDAYVAWANELRRTGHPEEALDAMAHAVVETRLREPKSETLSRLLNGHAIALAGLKRYEEAVDAYRESLAILSWNHGEGNPAIGKVRMNLGTSLFRAGRLDEAEREFELSLASNRELGEDLFVAGNQHFLGRIHTARGDLAAAEAAAREAIMLRDRHGLGMHTDRSRCLLGIIHARAGRTAEAQEVLTPLLRDAEPGYFLPSMEADARQLLGEILHDAGDHAARQHLQRALELKRELLGPEHEDCLRLEERLAGRR